MNPNLKRAAVWMPLVIAVTFVGGLLAGGYFLGGRTETPVEKKVHEIMSLVATEYVDNVNPDSILEVSIPDILAKLDPHTVYIPASELEQTNQVLEGSFGGIGVVFNMLTDTATVVEIVSGGPAEKVGMLAGDRIVTVDDSIVAGIKLESEKLRSRLKGPKGTSVKLGVMRSTAPDMLTFEVTRGDIPVTSIDAAYMITPETGYVRVNKFGRSTYMEFLNAMVNLKSDGAQQYIIDLRGNTGGYMEPAILMANEFLKGGSPIVSTRGRTPQSERAIGSDGSGAFQNEKIAVVIDEGSASASEIFAGAIQDNDRGMLVGRRSFGKGLVQNQIELGDSSAIRLTIARYYTPSGRCIQKAYTPGSPESYQMEIADRYIHGESFNADSVKLDRSQVFTTLGGREVYGGGGIMPDVYVPNDTLGITSYYMNVFNAGMLHNFAFNFADTNRSQLGEAEDVDTLLQMLPADDTLLQLFVSYAQQKAGIPPRWYYINISRNLIVNQLKALIASDILGQSALYEVSNMTDPVVIRTVEEISKNNRISPATESDEQTTIDDE
ncbi:MAG: S41 family peptidase [Bacteroides sp.]|nr:S41 family peptidase [Bacteroides sp.]MBD5374461.1 S41 family peptidase [Bacteroides sp.]